MRKLTHLSLFSGIGGLDLAAEWAGFKTVGQCEWADYPTKVLEKHWPDIPRWRDIKTLTKESFYERTGLWTADVISGGFPCQPFSVAGKQRGKGDDRYLWPEMVRVIKEFRPTWVVGENVTGIIRMALPDILSELEACGYRARAFHIPASGVGARHHRYRVAIVGYAEHNGLSAATVTGGIEKAGTGQQERAETPCEPPGAGKPRNSRSMGRTLNLENANSFRREQPEDVREQPVREQPGRTEPERTGEIMADAKSAFTRGLPIRADAEKPGFIDSGQNVQYADCTGHQEQHASEEPDQQRFSRGRCNEGADIVPNADNGSRDVRRDRELPAIEEAGSPGNNHRGRAQEHGTGQRRPVESCLDGMADGISGGMDGDLDFLINHYWDNEPDIPRLAAGVKDRVGRLKALGNAVVPQQFYPIFRAIAEIEKRSEGVAVLK